MRNGCRCVWPPCLPLGSHGIFKQNLKAAVYPFYECSINEKKDPDGACNVNQWPPDGRQPPLCRHTAQGLRKCVTMPAWPNIPPAPPVVQCLHHRKLVFGEVCETPHRMTELCPLFLLGTHQQDLTYPEEALGKQSPPPSPIHVSWLDTEPPL